MPKKPFFTFAFFGWLALVTYSSLSSFSGMDTESFTIDIPHADKLVHFIFYCTAAVLGVFFLREYRNWTVTPRKAFVLMFFLTIVFGIIIEVLQYSFTVNREGDFFDVLANAFGSLCGVFVCKLLFSEKGLMKWEVKTS